MVVKSGQIPADAHVQRQMMTARTKKGDADRVFDLCDSAWNECLTPWNFVEVILPQATATLRSSALNAGPEPLRFRQYPSTSIFKHDRTRPTKQYHVSSNEEAGSFRCL